MSTGSIKKIIVTTDHCQSSEKPCSPKAENQNQEDLSQILKGVYKRITEFELGLKAEIFSDRVIIFNDDLHIEIPKSLCDVSFKDPVVQLCKVLPDIQSYIHKDDYYDWSKVVPEDGNYHALLTSLDIIKSAPRSGGPEGRKKDFLLNSEITIAQLNEFLAVTGCRIQYLDAKNSSITLIIPEGYKGDLSEQFSSLISL